MTRHELNEVFARTSFLQGANATYLAQLHARYEEDPASVDPDWRAFFGSLDDNRDGVIAEARGPSWAPTREAAGLPARPQGAVSEREALAAARDTLAARMLIRNYRTRGHLAARLDPLELVARREHPELKPKTYGFAKSDYDRPIYIGGVFGLEFATLREILDILKRTYCGPIGVEYMHISDPEQRAWIQERIEGREAGFTARGKTAILKKLIEAETFERFLDVKYTGTKRFGLDGGESMVPALEQIIKRGGQLGVGEIVIGMPHRGRLNVLANVMAKPYRAIFNEFKGGSAHPDDVEGSGDVKYHLGASSDREFDLNRVHLSLTANPSHLEIVDPVVLGKVRAKQDQRDDTERKEVLPLLLHGDASFAGQGVVAECLGLSGLRGHRTGGSLHFIVNNQIGFTTAPRFSRSSPYPSDVAKMIDAPILHVNGDDPEAVVYVAKIATEFRQRFGKPVVIDMFCYRRHGHNEADEPAFTQPLMYARIRAHPSVVEVYSRRLVEEGAADPCRDRAHAGGFPRLSRGRIRGERRLPAEPRRLARRQMVGHWPCRGGRAPRGYRRRSRPASGRRPQDHVLSQELHPAQDRRPHHGRPPQDDRGRARHRLGDGRDARLRHDSWSRVIALGSPARTPSAARSPSATPC